MAGRHHNSCRKIIILACDVGQAWRRQYTGLDNLDALLAGVTTSGFYVRTARSPSVADLAGLLRDVSVAY